MKFITKKIDGEVMQVPDVKVGDRVAIFMDHRDYPELSDWLVEHEGELIVEAVEYDTFMIWLKDCDCGVSMEFISEVYREE